MFYEVVAKISFSFSSHMSILGEFTTHNHKHPEENALHPSLPRRDAIGGYGLFVFDLLVLPIGLWDRDELLHAHIDHVNLEFDPSGAKHSPLGSDSCLPKG